MDIAKILLPYAPRAHFEQTSQVAFALAKRFGASVEAMLAHPSPLESLLSLGEAPTQPLIDSLVECAREAISVQHRRASEILRSVAEGQSVPHSFTQVEGEVGPTVAHWARGCDVTMLPVLERTANEQSQEVHDAALFRSGRPVILVPPDTTDYDIGRTVIIAWKDGSEAARAVMGALPLLSKADAVKIVIVSDLENAREGAERLEVYLKAHEITSSVIVEPRSAASAAEILLALAKKQPAPLLVMGAYSHRRWREWAFGGMTDYMVHAATVPVLMSH